MNEAKIRREITLADGTKETLVFRSPSIKTIVDVMAYRRWLLTEFQVTEMARQIRDVYLEYETKPEGVEAEEWGRKKTAALWEAIDAASDEDKHKKSKADYWGMAELLKHLDSIETPAGVLTAPTEDRDAWIDANVLKRRSRNAAVLEVLAEVFGEGELERPGTDEAA